LSIQQVLLAERVAGVNLKISLHNKVASIFQSVHHHLID
jgi:hypothetical protein